MRYSPLVASAITFGISHALLLPPNISLDENEELNKVFLAQDDIKSLDEWVIEMEYPRTPELRKSRSGKPFIDAKSILEFNFTVQADRLMLNKLPIYPIIPMSQATIEPLSVPNLIKSDDRTWEYVSEANLGYAVNKFDPPQYFKQQDIEPISINVDIFKADGKSFEKIQTIEVQLLTAPSGKLGIQLAEISASNSQNFQISGHEEKCDDFLCKLDMGFSHLLSKAKEIVKKPCHIMSQLQRHYGHKIPAIPHPKKLHSHHNHDNLTPQSHSAHAHAHAQHHPHLDGPQPHHPQYRKESFFHNTIVPYLVPTLVAILAGIAAGLVGILFGYAAIYVWSVLYTRNSTKYTMIEQTDDIDQGTYHDLPSPNEFSIFQQDSFSTTSEKN